MVAESTYSARHAREFRESERLPSRGRGLSSTAGSRGSHSSHGIVAASFLDEADDLTTAAGLLSRLRHPQHASALSDAVRSSAPSHELDTAVAATATGGPPAAAASEGRTAAAAVVKQVAPAAELCPLTGKPPQVPAPGTSFDRCPQANGRTCCETCSDIATGLGILATNLTTVLMSITPSLVSQFGDVVYGTQTCTLIQGSTGCSIQLEQLACGIRCNPVSYKYLQKIPGSTAYSMRVCKTAASFIYDSCKNIQIKGLATDLKSVVPDPLTMLNFVLSIFLTSAGVPPIQYSVVPDGSDCYDLPLFSELPRIELCCDPLKLPSYCKPWVVNTSSLAYKNHANNTKDALNCASSEPPPPPPPPSSPQNVPSEAPKQGNCSRFLLSSLALSLLLSGLFSL